MLKWFLLSGWDCWQLLEVWCARTQHSTCSSAHWCIIFNLALQIIMHECTFYEWRAQILFTFILPHASGIVSTYTDLVSIEDVPLLSEWFSVKPEVVVICSFLSFPACPNPFPLSMMMSVIYQTSPSVWINNKKQCKLCDHIKYCMWSDPSVIISL